MTDHAIEHRLDRESKAAAALVEALSAADMGEDECLTQDMIEGETGLMEALDAALAEMDDCDVIAEGCKVAEERLATRRRRAEARRDKVRAAIEQALLIAEIGETVRRPTGTLTLAHRKPTLVVDDEAAIPSEFFVPQPPKLDKRKLADAAAERTVPGCHLTNAAPTLAVRRK